MPFRDVQLRTVFPDAPTDRPARIRMPGRASTHGRAIATAACLTLILAIVTAGLGIAFAAFELRNELVSTVLWVVSGVFWGLLVVEVVTILGINRFQNRGGTTEPWDDYARDRGLQPMGGTPVLQRPELPLLTEGSDRTFGGVLTGRARSTDLTLGTSTWFTNSGKSRTRHRLTFALVELPAELGTLFPSVSFLRFLRPVAGSRIQGWQGRELRLESGRFDRACSVVVDGAPPDDLRWRELFDPVLMEALLDRYDVQWQQRGRYLLLCATGHHGDDAPATDLDTLADAASFVVQRYFEAARGDVAAAVLTR